MLTAEVYFGWGLRAGSHLNCAIFIENFVLLHCDIYAPRLSLSQFSLHLNGVDWSHRCSCINSKSVCCILLRSHIEYVSEVSSSRSLGTEVDLIAVALRAEPVSVCPQSHWLPLMPYWKISLVWNKLTVMQLGWQERKCYRSGPWLADEDEILMFVSVVRDSSTNHHNSPFIMFSLLTYSYVKCFVLGDFCFSLHNLSRINLSCKTQSTNKILLQDFQNHMIIMSKIMAWLLEIIHRHWTVSHGK